MRHQDKAEEILQKHGVYVPDLTEEYKISLTPLDVQNYYISSPETRDGEGLLDGTDGVINISERYFKLHPVSNLLVVDSTGMMGYDLELEIEGSWSLEDFQQEVFSESVEALRFYDGLLLIVDSSEIGDDSPETYIKRTLPRMEDLKNLLVIVD